MANSTYERDFFVWTQETARAIAEERWNDIDRAALIDEVESLGKRDRREVGSRLSIILLHMLNLQYQPEKQSRSWLKTIIEQRDRLASVLDDSPSLRTSLPDLLGNAYARARTNAALETGLDIKTFPATCQWTISEILG